ncbi:alginate lyase family protein [Burkholderia gladioli]|uniref:alginate lyase family protein n=1 Tax=Burkholderia gladioli TaxID=28095 RepID=UPI00163FBBAB|nr:alginate lyase family protein [Burkholderia gladioli]
MKRRFQVSMMAGGALAMLALGAAGGNAQAAGFKHPGILVTQARLDYVKGRIAANNKLFVNAFNQMKGSGWASKTYKIAGTLDGGYISCDATSSNDHGCKAEQSDMTAAYTQALMWYLTGDSTYAKNAVSIMNFYARNLKGGHRGANAPLQSAWAAEVWPAAAEIIRYTYSGWSASDAKAFGTMLNTQHLPYITGSNGNGGNGNWKLSMIDGMIGIAVYNDDQSLFNTATGTFRQWMSAYYYNAAKDGGAPVKFSGSPGGWNGQTVFNAQVSGVTQEACRDTQHVGLGMAATFNAAETAYIQGTDLYAVFADRLTTSLEFLSKLLHGTRNTSQTAYQPVPNAYLGALCTDVSGHANQFVPVLKGTMVRAYNAYAIRKGMSLPATKAYLLDDIIPAAEANDGHNVQWEVLTHGDSPSTPVE